MDRYPYPRHTILLDTTLALAHIGVHIYTSRFSPIKFLASLPGISLVLILTTRQLDITLEFLFLFCFTGAGNLVFLFRV